MTEPEVAQAEARVALARARLTDALLALKLRLAPRRVVSDLKDSARQGGVAAAHAGVEAVKARPALAVGLAALAAAFLARKPITHAISEAISGEPDETPAPPARLKHRPTKTS